MRGDLGPHHAATSITKRLILLDGGLLHASAGKSGGRSGEFERILVHELFHFTWVRLSNSTRREWERHLAVEFAARVHGELGWSAEWRKDQLKAAYIRKRTLRWRRYACESFCDTAAWLYAGLGRHREFTLSAVARRARRAWFRNRFPEGEAVRI
jgi:hypothetical protein